MKFKIIVSIIAVLLSLSTVTTTFSQDTSGIKSLAPVTVTAVTKKIPNKVWKGFSTYFNDAENPKWFGINKNYLVKFMIYDEQNRALFTKRGSLIYHISYGYEKSLPEDLRKQIKSNYYDFNITRAVKITETDREIWIVNLEDQEHLILVQLENGEMEEVEKLEKSS